MFGINNFWNNILLFLLFSVFNKHVIADNEKTALPDCSGAAESTEAVCGSMTETTYCFSGNDIFYSEKAAGLKRAGPSCTKKTTSTASYYIFECGQNACGDPTTPQDNIIVYHHDGTTLTQKTDDKYYLIEDKKKLYQCKNADEGKCTDVSTAAGHYMDEVTGSMVTCASSSCAPVDPSIKGYFLNKAATAGTSGNSVIQCDGTGCSVITTDPEDYTGVGSVKVEVDDGHTTTTVTLCISGQCGDDEVEEISSTPSYHSLEVSANVFPGVANAGRIPVKVGADGSATMIADNSLPTCDASNTCSTGKYCKEINESGKLIIKLGSSGTCTAITNTNGADAFGTIDSAKDYIAYFNDDFEKEGTKTSATMAYSCTFTGSGTFNLSSCTYMRGFTEIGDSTVHCSGWKGEKCTSTEKASIPECGENNVKLNIGANNAPCSGIELPTDDSVKYAVFYPTDANEYYGIGVPKIYALALAKTSVVLSDSAKFKAGYQINLAVTGTKKNALIYCTTEDSISTCSVMDAHNGYYHPNGGENTDKLIKCDVSGCTLETIAAESYYINASTLDKSKIILCKEDGGIKCNSIEHGATANSPFHIIDNGTSKRVITCLASEGCYLEEKVKGYFLNSDTTEGAKKLITCNGTDCAASGADPTDYAGVGTMKVTENGITLCITVGCNGNGEIKVESSSAAPVYKTVTLATNSDFPGNGSGDTTISIRIGNDGSVLLLEDTGLTDTCAANIHCISSSKIKHNAEEEEMEEDAAGTYVYYFNTENERIDPPTLPGNIPNIMAYECIYDDTPALESCSLVKGYVVDSRTAITIHCSGWKHEGCRIISTTACASGDEGKLTSGRKICFNTSKIALPTVDDDEKVTNVAMVTSDINPFYGIEANQLAYLSMKYISPSYSSVTVSLPEDDTDTKYIVRSGNEFKLYDFDGDGAKTFALNKARGVITAKILTDGYTYKEETTLNTDTTLLFYCDGGFCKQTKGYMVAKNEDEADTLYSNDSGTWKEMISEDQACSTSSHVGNILMEGTPKIQLCKAASSTHDVINTGLYFYASGSSYTVLLGNHATTSTVVERIEMKNGYYLLNDNGLATNTGNALIQCTKSICKKIDPEVAFYPNAAGGKMIKCTLNGESTTCALDDTAGYYVDINKGLLSCDGSGTCESLDRVGYFLNKGDEVENIYIQCSTSECTEIPAPTDKCDDTLIGKLALLDDKSNADPTDDEHCLCLDSTISSDKFADSSFAMVKFSTGSVFKSYVSKNTYYGLVEIKSSYISLLFDNTKSVYCVEKAKLKATETACTDEEITATTHENYICNVDGVCIPATSTETLPESIRNVKKEESTEDDLSNAINNDCQVLNGNNCASNTYYLVDPLSYEITDIGKLYLCKNENEPCQEVSNVGYYIVDKTNSYSCQESGVSMECSIIKTIGTCAGNTDVGKIVYVAGKFSICLNFDGENGISVDLESVSNGNYIIGKNANTDIFGIGVNDDFAIININDKVVTLNSTYNNNLKYVYANKSDKLKLLEKGNTCPTKTGGSLDTLKLMELECEYGKCKDITPAPPEE